MQKRNYWFTVLLTGMITFSVILVLLISYGCMPPPEKPKTISPERQKAIEDSLRGIYEFELKKNWSTGYEYYKNKDYRSALKPFWKVAELDTIQMFKDVWSKLADSYFKLENADSVQIVCEKGLEKNPNNLYLHRSLAHILVGREMTEEAVTHYETIVKLDSKAAGDYKKLGNLYLKQDDVDAAIQAYEATTKINPQDVESQDILAKLYEQVDPEAMINRLEEIIKLDPKNTEAIFKLGRARFNRDEFAKAEQLFRNFLQKQPDDIYAMEYLGNSLQNQNKYRKAINVYNQIIQKDPNHKKIYCEMGSCYKLLNQFSKARSMADKSLKIDPIYGYARIVRGEIYEACVEYCMQQSNRKEANFDDKLVNELAYREYQKASGDLAYRDMAEKKKNWIRQFIPTKEDRFFNKGKTKAEAACYKWIY